jgi:phosphohistidine phosphatase
MKRLTLVRHAKSSWKNSALADVDRPLSGRGKRDAPRMASYLAQQGIVPDIILASPSRRTRQTAKRFAAELLGGKEHALYDPALYEAATDVLLERVRVLDDHWRHVMLVGHNPGLTDFADQLAGLGVDNIPTCGVVVIDIDLSSWREVAPRTGYFVLYVIPKDLPS